MWYFETKIGKFSILPQNGRYAVYFEDENLGSYATPEQAADDVAGGHTFWPSSGIDPGELDISDDLGDWEFSRR